VKWVWSGGDEETLMGTIAINQCAISYPNDIGISITPSDRLAANGVNVSITQSIFTNVDYVESR
jgi:hypothetical protein